MSTDNEQTLPGDIEQLEQFRDNLRRTNHERVPLLDRVIVALHRGASAFGTLHKAHEVLDNGGLIPRREVTHDSLPSRIAKATKVATFAGMYGSDAETLKWQKEEIDRLAAKVTEQEIELRDVREFTGAADTEVQAEVVARLQRQVALLRNHRSELYGICRDTRRALDSSGFLVGVKGMDLPDRARRVIEYLGGKVQGVLDQTSAIRESRDASLRALEMHEEAHRLTAEIAEKEARLADTLAAALRQAHRVQYCATAQTKCFNALKAYDAARQADEAQED